MTSGKGTRLSDKPIFVILAAFAAIATIIATCRIVLAFVTGTQYLTDILRPRDDLAPSIQTLSDVQILPPYDAHLEETQKTGVENRIVYDVQLAEDEVIVGDSHDFQDVGEPCNAFLIRGPGRIQLAVTDGAWYRYSGVNTQDEAEQLLQGRIKYLQNHWFCEHADIRVSRGNARD